MKRMTYIFRFTASLLILLAFTVCVAFASGANVISVHEGEFEVEPGTSTDLTIEIHRVPLNEVAVLEFTAWYKATRFAGYYPMLQVFWNQEELLDILDRPTAFTINDGRVFDTRGEKGWRVAVVENPEDTRSESAGRYRTVDEDLDVVKFRFEIAVSKVGSYPLEIRNLMAAGAGSGEERFPVLHIRDVKVRFERK